MRKLILTFILSLCTLITLAASRFWVGGTGNADGSSTTHISATSGGTSGASYPGSGDTFTFDANSGGGTVTVTADINCVSLTMGAFSGTLDFSANNNNITVQTFNCSGTGARTLNMGSGTWTCTGNATTIWTFATITNLTFNANGSSVVFSYSGSTGTRNIVWGSTASIVYNNISFSAGSDIITISNFSCTGNFSTSGFTGTFNKSSAAMTVGGSFTLGTGSTWSTTTGTLTLTSTGSVSINTNGVNLNQSVNINGTGTFTLANDLDMSGSVTTQLTVTKGTFTTSNYSITASVFNSSNSNTRVINLGSSTITLTGTGAVFTTFTGTGLTFNAGTSTIKANNSSSSSKTISPGGATLYNLWLTGGGTGVFIIGQSTTTSTFNNIKVDAPLTVQVFAGKTIVAASLTWTGSAGNINTIQSTTNGTQWILSIPSGNVVQDYVSLQDSYATGGAWYYATPHSTNVSGNSGWIFLPVGATGGFFTGN